MNASDYAKLALLLAFLAGPAGTVSWVLFVSNAVRNLMERELNRDDPGIVVWIHNLSSFNRSIFVGVISLLPPISAGLVLLYVPPEQLEAAQPVFAVIATPLIAYLIQQVWYQKTKSDVPSGTIIATTTAQKSTITIAPPEPNEGFG